MKLGEFLNVVGQGELLKIGFNRVNGFRFIDLTCNLVTNKKIQELYNHPIYNVYTCELPKTSISIILE